MECLLDNERKPLFKLLKPIVVVYGTIESMEGNVERVFGHIIWLLKEAQKLDSALDIK
jgi:RNAse (barnase) inhibitor barstar